MAYLINTSISTESLPPKPPLVHADKTVAHSTEAKPKGAHIVPVRAAPKPQVVPSTASESKVQTGLESKTEGPPKIRPMTTMTRADLAAAIEIRDCLEEGGKDASAAKQTLQNLVQKGVNNPNAVQNTNEFASSHVKLQKQESFAGIHNRDFPTVLRRKRNQRLAMNITVFYKEGEAITGKPQPIGVTFLPKNTDTTRDAVVEVVSHTGNAASKVKEPRVVASSEDESGSFGTWDGVWVSCVLNIFGVIMYRRLGWVVGEAGILGATAIILLSGVVTLLTTISMSAMATNGKVKGGGAYFLISRSVGPALGGAIGLLFTLGLCCGIAIYVVGFCETLIEAFGVPAQPPLAATTTTTAAFSAGLTTTAAVNWTDIGGESAAVNWIAEFGIQNGNCTCTCADEAACSGNAQGTPEILYTFFPLPEDLSNEDDWREFKKNEIRVWGVFLMVFCLIMAIIGVGWIIKVQFFLLALILASMVSIVIGAIIGPGFKRDWDFGKGCLESWCLNGFLGARWELFTENFFWKFSEGQNFFSVFAIFFPAVTGIMAGANISGLLKNPAVNIPVGTFHAILWTTIGYILLACILGCACDRQELKLSPELMSYMDLTFFLVLAGTFAATLSSALASIVGAPQMLGAIANDKLLVGCLKIFSWTYKITWGLAPCGFSSCKRGCILKAPFFGNKLDPQFETEVRRYLALKHYNSNPKLASDLFLCRYKHEEKSKGVLHNYHKQMPQGRGRPKYDVKASEEETKLSMSKYMNQHIIGAHRGEVDGFCKYLLNQCIEVELSRNSRTGLVTLLELKEIIAKYNNGMPLDAEALCCSLIQTDGEQRDRFPSFTEVYEGFQGMHIPVRYGYVQIEADPIVSYFASFTIGTAFVLMGSLDQIANLLSMFFLMTYCLLNWACVVQVCARSPGWRPTFKFFHWGTALMGALICLVCMFLTDPVYAIAAIGIAIALFFIIRMIGVIPDWGSAAEASAIKDVTVSLLALRNYHDVNQAKIYRPSPLVLLQRTPEESQDLCALSYTLRKGYGMVFLGTVDLTDDPHVQDLSRYQGGYYFNMRSFFKKKKSASRAVKEKISQMFFSGGFRDRYYAIVNRIFATSLSSGWNSLMTTSGLGALRPNVVLMELPQQLVFPEVDGNNAGQFPEFLPLDSQFHSAIQNAMKMRYSTMVVRFPRGKGMDYDRKISDAEVGHVDVWHISDTGGFTLLVPDLLARSKYWRLRMQGKAQCHKRVFACCETLTDVSKIQDYHEDMLFKKRLNYNVCVEALCVDDETRSKYRYPAGTPFTNDPCMPSPSIMKEFDEICPTKLADFLDQRSDEHKKQFFRWLRIAELMREQSNNASMVCVTLPFARSWIAADVYIALLRVLSNVSAPCFMLRGNGRSVLSSD